MSLVRKILCESSSKSKLTTFVNPHSYFLLRGSGAYSVFDRVHIDGSSLVFMFNIFLNAQLERKSFDMTSMAKTVFQEAEKYSYSVALVGSKPQEILKATQNIEYSFPGINIVCTSSGYFSGDEREQLLNKLLALNPEIIIVGMGTPLQEQFLIDLRSKGWVGIGYTCGGFFHQTSTSIDYYPTIFDKFNLRWLYRIYDEPKLFFRYFYQYPKAMLFIMLDIFIYKINKGLV